MFETKQERSWVIGAGIIILLITTLPYINAYSHNAQSQFSGFLFGIEDGNSYIAKMLQGAKGEWLFRSPYTTEEQKGFLAFLPYILIGKLSSSPGQHDQLIFLFHLFRWVSGMLLVLITYVFCAQFINSIHLRRIATLIAVVGGGSGWFGLLDPGHTFFGIPLEIYSPETFGFLSVFGLPHLLAARCFLLLGFLLFFKDPISRKYSLAAAICWLMVGFFQPLTIATGWVYLGGILIIWTIRKFLQNRSVHNFWQSVIPMIRSAAVLVLISSPWVIYNMIEFRIDPYLAGWASQNLITSPRAWDYLLSFLLLVPFAVTGLVQSWRKGGDRKWLFPLVVLTAFPFLAYAPFPMQRRLPDGIWLGITIAAMIYFDGQNRNKASKLPLLLLALSMLTPLIILAGSFQTISDPSSPIYQPKARVKAFEYLGQTVQPGSIVLAEYETANAIPAWAPVRVLVGLGPESVHFNRTLEKVHAFYSGNLTVDEQLELLKAYSVDYIFWGEQERQTGQWNPARADFLRKIYEQDGYAIYSIRQDKFNKQK